MIYKCKQCGEEYPYQPVFCNDCGSPFNHKTFSIIDPIEKVEIITLDDMYLNMQYYMEYCQLNGYVTPQKWLSELKHF